MRILETGKEHSKEILIIIIIQNEKLFCYLSKTQKWETDEATKQKHLLYLLWREKGEGRRKIKSSKRELVNMKAE